MRMLSCRGASLMLLCALAACADVTTESELDGQRAAVLDGQSATGDFPEIVYVTNRVDESEFWLERCTGVLLGPRVVLAPGGCFQLNTDGVEPFAVEIGSQRQVDIVERVAIGDPHELQVGGFWLMRLGADIQLDRYPTIRSDVREGDRATVVGVQQGQDINNPSGHEVLVRRGVSWLSKEPQLLVYPFVGDDRPGLTYRDGTHEVYGLRMGRGLIGATNIEWHVRLTGQLLEAMKAQAAAWGADVRVEAERPKSMADLEGEPASAYPEFVRVYFEGDMWRCQGVLLDATTVLTNPSPCAPADKELEIGHQGVRVAVRERVVVERDIPEGDPNGGFADLHFALLRLAEPIEVEHYAGLSLLRDGDELLAAAARTDDDETGELRRRVVSSADQAGWFLAGPSLWGGGAPVFRFDTHELVGLTTVLAAGDQVHARLTEDVVAHIKAQLAAWSPPETGDDGDGASDDGADAGEDEQDDTSEGSDESGSSSDDDAQADEDDEDSRSDEEDEEADDAMAAASGCSVRVGQASGSLSLVFVVAVLAALRRRTRHEARARAAHSAR